MRRKDYCRGVACLRPIINYRYAMGYDWSNDIFNQLLTILYYYGRRQATPLQDKLKHDQTP